MINRYLVYMFIVVINLFNLIYGQVKYYDRKYDSFDGDYFVQNPRLLQRYIECFLDKGPCTPVGRVFKSVLPELITTSCAKCTPSQKNFARKTFDAFKKFLPNEYDELKKKIDPTNIYIDSFEKAISGD
ncbi:allergen Tha p 1 isoform X2 [Galleria mellonella]|uniref:Allergen Tha p 1 isoform X2 n=1 Tax=Galleria mellonella TaxID=7137 RepID=A0A6J3C0K6_GALME|nr:allergen Tha p 1 isoform X2 [Galleria mellonella]